MHVGCRGATEVGEGPVSAQSTACCAFSTDQPKTGGFLGNGGMMSVTKKVEGPGAAMKNIKGAPLEKCLFTVGVNSGMFHGNYSRLR